MNTAVTELPDGRYVDAVVGYRLWRMFGDHGSMFLNSVWHPAMWDDQTKQLDAECNCWRPVSIEFGDMSIEGKATPHDHECGVYAWDDSRGLSKYMGGTIVVGEVRLWGEVHVHEAGYRAQHAQIAALFTAQGLGADNRKRIEIAALTYDVPIVTYDAGEVKH